MPQGLHRWKLCHDERDSGRFRWVLGGFRRRPRQVGSRTLEFADHRASQKAKFRGELFPVERGAEPDGTSFLDFFQTDRDGNAKGIVVIELGDLS